METSVYAVGRRRRPFRDREEAGGRLAEALAPLVDRACVVAAIPRGGISVALPVVERLGVPLSVVYARKLTAPIAPELALGVLDEDGQTILEEEIVKSPGLAEADVESAKKRVAAEIKCRMALYRVPPIAGFLPRCCRHGLA